jgi:hypothetical protein
MRRLASYIAKYGPEAGPKLYHALQSQAAHAGVSARRKRKIADLLERRSRLLPLFDSPPARETEAKPSLEPVLEPAS